MAKELLKKSKYFSTIPDDQLGLLASIAEKKSYASKEVLGKEGEPQTAMYLVTKGGIVRTKQGKELSVVEQGQHAGFLHLFSQDPMYATLTVLENSEVFVIESSKFNELLSKNPDLTKTVVSILTREVRNQTKALSGALSLTDKELTAKVLVFDSKNYWEKYFNLVNKGEAVKDGKKYNYRLEFTKEKLCPVSADYCKGYKVVCAFVNDNLGKDTIAALSNAGVKLVALRCAGYDNVDLDACHENEIEVVRVPAYSPYAVAEHAISLLMTLNRKIHRSYSRVKEGNFSLEGLVGFDMYGKTAGVIGTGKIGRCLINILLGFGCKVLCYDIYPSKELEGKEGVQYVSLDDLLAKSDVISLHAPLTKETRHMLDDTAFGKMKKGVLFVNTSRGALVDSKALISAIEKGIVAAAGLDVYEDEKAYFFEDHSDKPIKDDVLARLTSFNNVIITGHQAFLTEEAIINIANTTLENISLFLEGKKGKDHPNSVKKEY